jgi:hypothetical protein
MTSTLHTFTHKKIQADPLIRGLPRPEKNLNFKEMLRKFQNARQAITDRNMVKFSSANAPNT